eukprot:scaffold2006_cov283-Chaetoceros_neogracile.AAC.29
MVLCSYARRLVPPSVAMIGSSGQEDDASPTKDEPRAQRATLHEKSHATNSLLFPPIVSYKDNMTDSHNSGHDIQGHSPFLSFIWSTLPN